MKLPKRSKGISLKTASNETKRSTTQKYLLRLFVTGTSSRSSQSIMNLRAFCEKHLHNQCKMEVIDIYQQPGLARDEQIVATPTLIKKFPLPVRIMIGDFSDQQRMATGLDLSLTNT